MFDHENLNTSQRYKLRKPDGAVSIFSPCAEGGTEIGFLGLVGLVSLRDPASKE